MGSRSGLAWCWLLATLAAVGCATPSRRLTTRAVDDPAVLPARLASVSLAVSADRLDTTQSWSWQSRLPFRYGITDRLELNSLTLRYAVFDDAPPPPGTPPEKPRDRLRLVVRGGLEGIGYSSLEELIVLPALSVGAAKRVSDHVRFWADLSWDAFWVNNPQPRATLYTPYLWPRSGHGSSVTLSVGTLVQLVDHLALTGSIGVSEVQTCIVPTCDWAARSIGASVGPAFRPWHWLAVSVRAYAGERWRPADPFIPPPPPPPPLTPDLPPGHVTWAGVSGTVTFFW